MKKYSHIIIVLSILFIGSLIFWQIDHLNEMQSLKADLEQKEIQSVLLESAIELRKLEATNQLLRKNHETYSAIIDSVLNKNFTQFNRNIIWGYYNGLNKPIEGLNNYADNIELINSSLKVCTSCLLVISMVKDIDPENISEDELQEAGYILDHTPAQMRDVRGIDDANLKYLHIATRNPYLGTVAYIVPTLLLIGLSSLFIWLLYLNNKQTKLIKQKNEFVNHLSHQFQTPLSSIKLSANLLINKNTSNPDELIKIIQTESNRLENHIKTVLHWVKSDAERLHITQKKISVTDIVERSLKQMKPVFLTNGTTVNFIPPQDEFMISADENHLQLMLFNIWENAIKHNEDKIRLTIECKKTNNQVSIITIDNGKGLPKEIAPEKFKGLGLAYVRRIMLEHEGSMKLDAIRDEGLSVQLNFAVKND